MNRLEFNKKILTKLGNFIEDCPNLRFIQALWAIGIIDADKEEKRYVKIIDRFNEESNQTLYRIDKKEIKEEKSDYELFVCTCSNVEHQLIFTRCDNFVSMSVYLVSVPWYKRIQNAIKYIFGYKSKYGDFDEFIFNSRDADKLQKIVNQLKK